MSVIVAETSEYYTKKGEEAAELLAETVCKLACNKFSEAEEMGSEFSNLYFSLDQYPRSLSDDKAKTDVQSFWQGLVTRFEQIDVEQKAKECNTLHEKALLYAAFDYLGKMYQQLILTFDIVLKDNEKCEHEFILDKRDSLCQESVRIAAKKVLPADYLSENEITNIYQDLKALGEDLSCVLTYGRLNLRKGEWSRRPTRVGPAWNEQHSIN